MPSFAEQTFLVTGAAGFIGGALGNSLVSKGASVRGIDSFIHSSDTPLKFECERGDVRWPDLLLMRAKDADAIIHLAAVINVDFSAAMPEYVYDVNLEGTINVLEAARHLDKKVVFASSSEVYGTAQASCINERHVLDGQSPYAASKIAADRACYAWASAYGMDINIVRLFNTFGPHQASDGYGGVIAKFTKAALSGKPMQIYGSGEQRRDYLYIDDAVDAYLLALTTKFKSPVNFGTGTTISIVELAEGIGYGTGYWPPATDVGPKTLYEHVKSRPGEVDVLRCDASKARSMGWEPKVSFQDGLHRYVTWAKSQN